MNTNGELMVVMRGPGSHPWGVTGTQHILTEPPMTHNPGGQTLEHEGPKFS